MYINERKSCENLFISESMTSYKNIWKIFYTWVLQGLTHLLSDISKVM